MFQCGNGYVVVDLRGTRRSEAPGRAADRAAGADGDGVMGSSSTSIAARYHHVTDPIRRDVAAGSEPCCGPPGGRGTSDEQGWDNSSLLSLYFHEGRRSIHLL
jgi:hypothetical protein